MRYDEANVPLVRTEDTIEQALALQVRLLCYALVGTVLYSLQFDQDSNGSSP